MSSMLAPIPAPISTPINIVVLGKGAIGSLWSYHLTKSSRFNVSTINNEGLADAPQLDAASFTNADNFSFNYTTFRATKACIANADILLVCLKSCHLAQTLNQLRESLSVQCDIILCHNGMGVLEAIDKTLSEHHNIYTMLTTHGAFRPSKKHVLHTGVGFCDIGASSPTEQKPGWLDALGQAFATVNWVEDIRFKQWQKLAVNCVINPLTALNKVKNGEMLNDKYLGQIKQIATEVAKVAQHQGIHLHAEAIINTVLDVADKTALNTSSMLTDVLANRQTEVDNINGYIAQLAKQYNLETPLNQQLAAQVAALTELK